MDMSGLKIWLVYYKAEFGEGCTESLDGSSYMVGLGVVPAKNLLDAVPALSDDLKADKMLLVDVWKCELYREVDYTSSSDRDLDIRDAARGVADGDGIYRVLGVSSEILAEEDGDDYDHI